MTSSSKGSEILFKKSAINKQQQQHLLPPPPQRKSNPQKPLQVSFRLSPPQSPHEHHHPTSASPPAYQIFPAPIPEITAILTTSQAPQFDLCTTFPVENPQEQMQQKLTFQLQQPLQLPPQHILPPSEQNALPQPQQQNLTNFKIPLQNQLLKLSATPCCNIPSTELHWQRTITNATSNL